MGRDAENDDLKEARGTLRADRRAKTVDFTPMKVMVKTPKGLLTTGARREWTRVVKSLNESGLLAEADKSLLIAYCNEIDNYRRWGREIAEARELKLPVPHRQSDCTQALKNAMKLAEMFGLTPSARGKIKAPKKKQTEDPTALEFSKLLSA